MDPNYGGYAQHKRWYEKQKRKKRKGHKKMHKIEKYVMEEKSRCGQNWRQR